MTWGKLLISTGRSWESGVKARARARRPTNLRVATKMVEKKLLQPLVVPMVATSWHSNFGSTCFTFFTAPYNNACKGARAQDRLLCLDPGQIGSGSHIPFIHPWWLQNHAINTLLGHLNEKTQPNFRFFRQKPVFPLRAAKFNLKSATQAPRKFILVPKWS